MLFSCLLLPILSLVLHVSRVSAALDPEVIDFPTIPGWNHLSKCVRDCFTGWGNRPAVAIGCETNTCLCRADHIFMALQWMDDCLTTGCVKNALDHKGGMEGLKQYCAARGMTEIKAPETTEKGGSIVTIGPKGTPTVATVTYTTTDAAGKTVVTFGPTILYTTVPTIVVSSRANLGKGDLAWTLSCALSVGILALFLSITVSVLAG